MGLLLLGAAAAEAQTSVTFVSNQGQLADDSASTSGNDHAQLFHTGAHANGYTFTGMYVSSEDAEGDDFDVEICEADTTANEFPTATCTALTAPGSFAAGLVQFTHTGLALSANTNYVVVIKQRGTGSVELNSTPSGAEDTTGLSGWSIKDTFYWNNSGTWTVKSGANEALRIILQGYARTTVTTCSVAAMQNQVWTENLTVGTRMVASVTFLGWNDSGDFTGASLTDQDFTFGGDTYNLDQISLSGRGTNSHIRLGERRRHRDTGNPRQTHTLRRQRLVQLGGGNTREQPTDHKLDRNQPLVGRERLRLPGGDGSRRPAGRPHPGRLVGRADLRPGSSRRSPASPTTARPSRAMP